MNKTRTTPSMQNKGIDKYANTQTTMCTQYTGNTVHKKLYKTQTKTKS